MDQKYINISTLPLKLITGFDNKDEKKKKNRNNNQRQKIAHRRIRDIGYVSFFGSISYNILNDKTFPLWTYNTVNEIFTFDVV